MIPIAKLMYVYILIIIIRCYACMHDCTKLCVCRLEELNKADLLVYG